MPALEVVPAALVSAAAAVRCFALDLDPVIARSGSLEGAVADFSAHWSQAMAGLAADADVLSLVLREAAAEYARLDATLVPR